MNLASFFLLQMVCFHKNKLSKTALKYVGMIQKTNINDKNLPNQLRNGSSTMLYY